MTEKNFDLMEAVEQIFAQIKLPPGINAIGIAETEALLAVASKFFALTVKAESLFKEIEAELGIDQAKGIFGALAAPDTQRSKRKVEKFNNILLLLSYIEMKLPLQQFARRLADGNGIHPGPFGLRYRDGTSEAIEQQLKRLLKQQANRVQPGHRRQHLQPAVRRQNAGNHHFIEEYADAADRFSLDEP